MGGRLWAIIVKEMLAILRDRRSRMTLIGPPLLQFLLFSFAATLEVKNVDIGLYDRDGGAASQELVSRIAGSPNVRRLIRLESPEALREAIEQQKVIVALTIDQQFSTNVAAGNPATVQAVFDGRRSNAAQIVSGYLERIVGDLNADITVRAARAPPSEGHAAVTHWFNPNLDYMWFIMPGLIVIIGTISSMTVVSQSVARERELGTFEQLLVTPLRVHEILIGKMVPPLVIGTITATVYLIIIPIVFGVPLRGSIPLFYFALFFNLLALIGMGMLITTLTQTQQQAFLGMFLVVVPTTLLSGFSTPVDNMPGWLQFIALGNPPTYFFVICEGIFLKAMPASAVFSYTWPLMIIAAVTLSASAYFFRARME